MDMKGGNWSLTGQGISFDVDGNLLDGQHRLAAVVRSGVTISMIVLWDLPENVNKSLKTIDTFDIGRKRALGEQLGINGFMYSSSIASASRILALMVTSFGDRAMSNPQGMAVANLMKNHFVSLIEILGANHAPSQKYSGRILAPLALLRTVEPDTADLFATEFNELANLPKTSPVLQFQKFIERPTHLEGGTANQQRTVLALSSALFFYCNEKKVEQIRGNKEHYEWLLKTCRNAVSKIREVAGIVFTMEELKNK
jgi:hypothetical protein